MSDRPALDGVLAVELSAGVACAYAGRLLCDLGATVVMVEPPSGSPLRRRAALFAHLAGGKQSLVAAGPGDQELLDLVAAADVLLRDGEGAWGRLGVDAGPAAVDVDVTAFGADGPHAGWVRSDLALWALGGYHSFTGDPGREPVWIPGSQAALHAGAYAAVAALGGLWERRRSGRGQHAEVAELDSVLAAHAWLVSSWEACGQVLPRVESDLVRAADGWVYFMRIAPNDELFVLIDRPDLAAEGLTADVPTWFANIPRVFAAAAEWAATRTVDADRRAGPGAAGGGHARPRHGGGRRRPPAGGEGLVGARPGRWLPPGPAVPPRTDAEPAPWPGPGDRRRRPVLGGPGAGHEPPGGRCRGGRVRRRAGRQRDPVPRPARSPASVWWR